METADELTAGDTGVWLVSDEIGGRCIVNLDAHTVRIATDHGFWGTEYEPLTINATLPRVGMGFADGTPVRRIMRLPEMAQVARKFKNRIAQVDVDYGWYPLVADMHAALAAMGTEFEYDQIKEKFGELRVYMRGRTDAASEIIAAAHAKAATTCERCGAAGRMRTRQQWLQTLCDVCASAKRCDEVGIGDTVEELTAGMRGVWKVTTQGSEHIWDMNGRTYTRFPGAASLSGAFDYDGEPQRITRVDRYPVVGSYFLVRFDDPVDPEHVEQFRRSSGIERIERVR